MWFNDASILLCCDVYFIEQNAATEVGFENYAPFVKRIRKIHGTTANDAEDLDLVMMMYNL